MKVSTAEVATREVELTIEPDVQAVQDAMRKAAREISRYRPVPGYRPGKAPYAMVERVFGRELILNQAVNEVGPAFYRDALKSAELEPYEQGQLDVESEDPLVLKARVALMPVVTLADYAELSIEPEPEVSVTDEQVEEAIERLRRRNAEFEPVERPLAIGDQLAAAVHGTDNEGQQVVNQENATFIVDDKMQPPGFSEALVGISAGEEREFSLTYPEDYDEEDLAGKNVSFKVSAKTVRETKLPAVDDDLAKTAGDYETVEDMRAGIAESLKQNLEREAREREAEQAIEALVGVATVEYPSAALEHEIHAALDGQKARVQQVGFQWENYLRMIGKTEAELHEQVRPEAERRLVRRLVLTEYARSEKLTVSQGELASGVANIASAYGDRAPEIMGRLRDSGAMFSIYADLLTQKAVTHLTARLTGREIEEEESAEDAEADAVAEAGDESPTQEGAAETDDVDEAGE
ncbi:MAG: trigger factor [Anaerolineae bacterium]